MKGKGKQPNFSNVEQEKKKLFELRELLSPIVAA